ncbi:MAG TPA: alcohol dehydrogenase catalytic domain-containing protein [bacterium]|nr:alcohol dehydrogenase catalytic domain-containing protein [bacterium]
MNAVQIKTAGEVELIQEALPVAADNEIRVQPLSAGICGTDVHILQGDFIGSYPVIPGHEFCGRIEATGPSVQNLRPGDMVAIDPNIRCGVCSRCREGRINLCERYEAIGVTRPGAFADRVCVPAAQAHRFHGDPQDGAFAEPLACVLYGLHRLEIQPDTRVAIWGGGSIGLLHLQVCSRLLGCRVTLIESDPVCLVKARKLHPEKAVLNDSHADKTLRELCPQGFEIGIDATGNIAAVKQLFSHLRRGGQALLFGVYPQNKELSISPFQIFLNDWKIVGSVTYRHEFSRAVALLESGSIRGAALVDHRIGLPELPDFLQRLAAGERLGKVQVVCSDFFKKKIK